MEKEIQYWQVKSKPLSGTTYKEVRKNALVTLEKLQSNPKRKAYQRSKYFKKQKVFFYYFWNHLLEKRMPDRIRRLRLLPCAIELIKDTTFKPQITINPSNKKETLYRFYGALVERRYFVVQIKMHQQKGSLQCISIFPAIKR